MQRLSLEILNNIFVFLHQRDKLECMVVCRWWACLIQEYSLFHTVRVDNMKQLEKVLDRLRQEPEQKKKVRRLFLDLYADANFDLNLVALYFPNLRFLGSTDRDHSPAIAPQGISYIEHIAEQNSSTWTLHLLGSSLCWYLRILDFDASSVSDEKLGGILKNAPSLTHLTMYSCSISFGTLEQLHSDLPFIQTLRLKDTREMRGPLPLSITSDSVLTVFEISFQFIKEVLALTLVTQFINRKYTKLEKLVLMEPQSTAMDKGSHVWYDQGLYPLISERGRQLKELCVYTNGLPAKVFHIIDNAHCNLKKLELADPVQSALTGSAQLRYIQSLKLIRITRIDFRMLKAANMLKYLSLSYVRTNEGRKNMTGISLDRLLDACSNNIEVLELENARLDLEYSSRHFDSLKTLTLDSMYLPAGINGNISRKLPQLQTLKIRNCDMKNKKIMLRGVSLYAIEIADKNSHNKDILVRTLNDPKPRWWITQSKSFNSGQDSTERNGDDAPLYPEGKYLALADRSNSPMVTLECNSVKKISIF